MFSLWDIPCHWFNFSGKHDSGILSLTASCWRTWRSCCGSSGCQPGLFRPGAPRSLSACHLGHGYLFIQFCFLLSWLLHPLTSHPGSCRGRDHFYAVGVSAALRQPFSLGAAALQRWAPGEWAPHPPCPGRSCHSNWLGSHSLRGCPAADTLLKLQGQPPWEFPEPAAVWSN